MHRQEPTDTARGRRLLDLDAFGRPVAWTNATGTTLRFQHDGGGNLMRIASGDWSIDIEGQHKRRTFAVVDPAGRTEMQLARGGRMRTLARGADRVSIELDDDERVHRVELPGSVKALVYDWDDEGDCVIRAEGGRPLLRLNANGPARRIMLDDTTWLDEHIEPGRVRLTAAIDNAVCDSLEITLQNLAAVTERRWLDGSGDRFTRDEMERLASRAMFDVHGVVEERPWTYLGPDLAENEQGRRTLGEAGRVLALDRADGTLVTYRYDAAGRRISRSGPEGETRYFYDPLGTLCRVDTEGGHTIVYRTDGMGRRVATLTDGEVSNEHRDEIGRLWAVTDAAGRVRHVYIWIGDRIAARIDGAIGAPLAEAYMCDPFGTPNGVLLATNDGWRFERLAAPPFGRNDDPARPTLYGHFGDPATGLIHFGARDLDPELGLFLNPDPWHGGADDPRRWSGVTDADLAMEAERGTGNWHDYALCRFDPMGRYDSDGHLSAGDVVLHILRWMLLPTWGFPLTAISLFFFQPVNFYFEIAGLIIWGFKQLCEDKTHPWGYNTIAKAQLLLGSKRQFTFALGLNGFLPRVVSGHMKLMADRAVTVGNVIWINRDELSVLARPEVVELPDIGGATGGFNTDIAKRSVVALLVADKHGKQRLHVSGWTRGLGNAVQSRPVPAGTAPVDGFVDKPVRGAATGRSAIHLRHPVPLAIDVPSKREDKESIEVHEFVQSPIAIDFKLKTPASAVLFALAVPKDSGFVVGDWLRIVGPGLTNPVFRRIREVQAAGEQNSLILNAALPTKPTDDLQIQAVKPADAAVPSLNWTAGTGAASTTFTLVTPTPPATSTAPTLSANAFIRIVATAGTTVGLPLTPGGPAPVAEDTQFAAVTTLRARLMLEPDRGGATIGTKLRRMRADNPFAGILAKAAEPAKIRLVAPTPDIEKDDLLIVRRGTGAPVFVRAKGDPVDGVIEVDPDLPATIAAVDATKLELRKAVPQGDDADAAEFVAAGPGTADIDVKVPSTTFFQPDNLVRLVVAGSVVLRRVAAIPRFEVDATEPAIGSGPFALTKAVAIPERVRKDVSLASTELFLEVVSRPSTPIGNWPNKILSIQFPARVPQVIENGAHYIRWGTGGRLSKFADDFRNTWSLTNQGGVEYMVLEAPLPLIYRKDSDGNRGRYWRVEPDDYEGRTDLFAGDGQLEFVATEYDAGPTRTDQGDNRVLANEPEALVPEDPTIHDTHRRALMEHEIHHTVQCNYWGPFMTALPLPGVLMSVGDMLSAAGASRPDWLSLPDNPNEEMNWVQALSIAGIMELFWRYIFLSPIFLRSPELKDKITNLDFGDINKVVNPVSRLITEQLPQVNPNASAGTRWLQVLGQVLSRALDLRSWTPGLGFVPTLLPDGETNFIEQGASRASGDLYSTILTADNHYNLHTRGRFFGSHTDLSANLQSSLGKPIRLLSFYGSRSDRAFVASAADAPGVLPVFRDAYHSLPSFTITVTASPLAPAPASPTAPIALFPAALYSVTKPNGTLTNKVTLEGVPPARATAEFFEAAAGDIAQPTLRAYVPLPPRVNRSMGFYLVPGGHARMTVRSSGYRFATIELGGPVAAGDTVTITLTSPGFATPPGVINVVANPPPSPPTGAAPTADLTLRAGWMITAEPTLKSAGFFGSGGGTKIHIYMPKTFDAVLINVSTTGSITKKIEQDDPKEGGLTETVMLTFCDEVKLGGEDVPWSIPTGIAPTTTPPTPAPVPATVIRRFQLEDNELRIRAPQGTTSTGLVDVGSKDFKLDIDSSITQTELTDGKGWKLVMPDAVPASASTRFRIIRTIKTTDPAFNLTFPDVPTLAGVTSYLDADTFIVVRDVVLQIDALPELAPQSSPWDKAFELKLPIRLAQGERGITIIPVGGGVPPPYKRLRDDGRGEIWSIGPMLEAPGDDVDLNVSVTYGQTPHKVVTKTFVLSVKASLKVTGASFKAEPGTPLELNLAGGTSAHTIELVPKLEGLEVTQSPGKIRLLATAAPDVVTDVKVIVKDSSTPAKVGVRHVSVSNMPPILLPNPAGGYFEYVRPATLGLAKPLINGRSSGGTGPDVDLTEPLDAMERAVTAVGSGDTVYLSSWFFEPATPLIVGGVAGVATWGQLLVKKATDGVRIRILINDFDPISGLDKWLKRDDLTPLDALIGAMPAGKRDNLKYLVCLHPAHVGFIKAALAGQGLRNIYVASHHQKFMVVRKGSELTAFCGGLDIESRKTPANWVGGLAGGWHDLHVQLEGPIAYDLEREFVERWNRSKGESTHAALAGWAAMETLSQTAISPADDVPAKKVHVMQMTRTVSDNAVTGPYTTKRNDIAEMYRRAIKGSKQFIYLENQYFRSAALADWIVAAGKANPALLAIMVVVASAAADDGHNAVTDHGDHLQFDTFDRIKKGLGARAAFYTMTNRAVHSKFMLIDDAWMTIGSANANVRSFELDSELNVQIADAKLTKDFRGRLWAHNLGETEAGIAALGIPDFIAKWNSVAVSNRGKAIADMLGEGVVPYDYTATPGTGHGSIPDALAQLDFGRDGGVIATDTIT